MSARTSELFLDARTGVRFQRFGRLCRLGQLSAKAGVKARPHGQRHPGITSALDAFNRDYRKARAFSRHASLDTVRRYGDNWADHAGQVTLDSIFG